MIQLIDSKDCIAFTVPMGKQRRITRDSLLYRIEGLMPFDLEDVIVDFVSHPDSVFVVARTNNASGQGSDKTEEQSLPIYVIPRLLYLLQAFRIQDKIPGNCVVVREDNQCFDIVKISEGLPCSWSHIQADAKIGDAAIERAKTSEIPIIVIGVSTPEFLQDESLVSLLQPSDQVVASLESCLRNGRITPWIDLSSIKGRQPVVPMLGRLPVISQTIILSLLAFVALSFWWKAMSTDSEVEYVESQQIQVYRRLFPTGPKPKNVRRRLESELAAIEQTMGQQDATPPDVNASWVWLSLLNRLMSADNYRIDEMTIANSEILSLTGSATSYADVEDVYNTLREGGFEFQISNASMNDGRIQLAINRAKLLDERLLEERRIDP